MKLSSQKNKKKILLVYDGHSHIVENNLMLLSGNFNIHSYCPYKYKYRLTHLKNKIEFFKYPIGLVYLFLIIKSFKYNYIFITTGPQNVNRKTGLLILFFYSIFILLHGKKTIMGIRDNKKYFRGINTNLVDKLKNFIRNKSILKIKLLFFETKTTRNNFTKKFTNIKSKCFINYPYRHVKVFDLKNKFNSNIIRIGLLGTLSIERKNYKFLISALNKLNKNYRKNIIIVVLGEVKMDSIEVIKKIRKHVNIEYQKNFISQNKLDELASSCHFYVSPLKKGFGGADKGTGSILDAISTKKRLIIPFHADPKFEFKNFCYYYKDANDLKIKLFNFLKKKLKPLKAKTFEKYNNNKLINIINRLS